jgi:hypothetical protein
MTIQNDPTERADIWVPVSALPAAYSMEPAIVFDPWLEDPIAFLADEPPSPAIELLPDVPWPPHLRLPAEEDKGVVRAVEPPVSALIGGTLMLLLAVRNRRHRRRSSAAQHA